MTDRQRLFDAVVTAVGKRVIVPVPFDPDKAWGVKPTHHVRGTVNGVAVRSVIERVGDCHAIALGAAWRRDSGVAAGDSVTVSLEPEGPQRADLAPDLRAALAASPKASAFFDSLAQFYRRAYLRWIDATTRRPEARADRIDQVIKLLEEGRRERPR